MAAFLTDATVDVTTGESVHATTTRLLSVDARGDCNNIDLESIDASRAARGAVGEVGEPGKQDGHDTGGMCGALAALELVATGVRRREGCGPRRRPL